jgi:hypothetical protein
MSSMQSMQLMQPSAKKRTMESCVKNSVTWEELRKGILAAVLYAKSSGMAMHIYSVIKEFYADYSQMPIPALRESLKRLASSKQGYSYFCASQMQYPIPKLPAYSKNGQTLTLITEANASTLTPAERRNQWSLDIDLHFWNTRRNYKTKRAKFEIRVKMSYNSSNFDNRTSNPLDCYKRFSSNSMIRHSLEFGLPGTLQHNEHDSERQLRIKKNIDYLQNDKFVHEVRDIIMTSIYRLKKKKWCQHKRTRGRNNKIFEVKCGAPVPDGMKSCMACWKKDFARFINTL